MSRIYWIRPDAPSSDFPPLSRAFTSPDGLLAAGGDLSPARLLEAYSRGIFPWYEEGQPILWWSPDPRSIIFPNSIHRSRSLQRSTRKLSPTISINCAFDQVIDQCARPRYGHDGTWITADMKSAYKIMHELGHAHSLEVWVDNDLAGGIYGIAIGGVFFGESMFSNISEGSKIAITRLASWLADYNFALLDCQVTSAHLKSLGSVELPRNKFVELIAEHCSRDISTDVWEKRDKLPL